METQAQGEAAEETPAAVEEEEKGSDEKGHEGVEAARAVLPPWGWGLSQRLCAVASKTNRTA